ncbi:DUF4150 domain-containing protein [Endomicrobium sp. AH-315-J14]|nr:DUF4150 domain-containing protein [Endomicrobium sp. AH-315-J14]
MGKPACTKKGGLCLAFPDTCHLPAPPPPGGVPTPYPNKDDPSSTDKATKTVLMEKKGVCVENNVIPRSSGDEAGCSSLPTPKGLMSQTNMSKVIFKTHSSKVKAQGKGIVPAGATTAHNGGGNKNMPAGKHIKPSQTKVWIG